MTESRRLLQHFLAALAYRTQKALRGAPDTFAEFRAGAHVRTPHELVWHMTGVIGYARTMLHGGELAPPRLPSFAEEVARFHETLAALRDDFANGALRARITSRARRIHGGVPTCRRHLPGRSSRMGRMVAPDVPPASCAARFRSSPVYLLLESARLTAAPRRLFPHHETNSMPATRATLLATLVLAATGAVCSSRPAPCPPLETRQPNARDQRPAFAAQTRGCGVKSNVAFDVTVVATGLAKPWAVEPLPGGDFLVTEKAGRLRIVSRTGTVGEPITGVPAVDARGQGGLLDVALSPSFASDRTIFWSFSEPRDGGNGTSIARGVLSPDRRSLGDVRVIFRVLPTYEGTMHYGSRLAFGPDGMLYATFGDRSDRAMRPYAQRLDSHLGKIVRIRPDGSAPPDNPFVGQANAQPEIWSVGHRNIQAAAFDARGQLWEVEHGTRGGDELNRIEKGKNYGWAEVGYGVEYSGQPLPGPTAREGTEQPVYYWDPVIAPSGAQFYTGDAFPAWRNSLFVGALKEQRLVRLTLDNGRVTGEEHLLADRGRRIRDVRQGPDGALYVVTDDQAGELWRIAPRR